MFKRSTREKQINKQIDELIVAYRQIEKRKEDGRGKRRAWALDNLNEKQSAAERLGAGQTRYKESRSQQTATMTPLCLSTSPISWTKRTHQIMKPHTTCTITPVEQE